MYLLINKIIFLINFLLISSLSVFASPNIQARTAILIDYHSDEILFELDPTLRFILRQ